MKSDSSEFRLVLKDNPELSEEFMDLKAGDKDVDILIRIQVNGNDEHEISGFITGARIEKAPKDKKVAHNTVEVLGGSGEGQPTDNTASAPGTATNIAQTNISPAALI